MLQNLLGTSAQLGRFALKTIAYFICSFTQVAHLSQISHYPFLLSQNKTFKPGEHRPVVYPEVLLCVEVYEKRYGSVKVMTYILIIFGILICRVKYVGNKFFGDLLSLQSQEFLVLGSQLLTDLRDNIYCFKDKLMNVAKQHVHSGYFLIEVCICEQKFAVCS